MPTYTYKCKDCEHQFDARQKFSDAALSECPNCEGRLRRLVNNVGGIVFKGSGFYINDSKSGKKSKTSSKDSETSKESDSGKASSKEESKASEGKSSESKSSEKKVEKA